MEDLKKSPAPVEPDGMNIHLAYIRRDIDEIKISVKELGGRYVTMTDYQDHLKTSDDHEQRIRELEEERWKVVGASSIISALGSGGLITLLQHLIK